MAERAASRSMTFGGNVVKVGNGPGRRQIVARSAVAIRPQWSGEPWAHNS